MPGFDGTGPLGRGPRTGGGFGPCASFPYGSGFGRGLGFGRGRGFRHIARLTGLPGWQRFGGYPAAPADPSTEKAILENQAKKLEEQLAWVRERLNKGEKL